MAKIGLCIIRHSISNGKVHLNWKNLFQVEKLILSGKVNFKWKLAKSQQSDHQS